MKYASLIVCAAVAAVMLSSCGDSTPKVKAEYVAPAGLTAENWADKAREMFAFDLSVPEGWKFSSGTGYATSVSYNIEFSTEAEDLEVAVDGFYKHVFALTEKTSAEGNFAFAPSKWEVTDKFTEIAPMGIEYLYNPPVWFFKTGKGVVQFVPLFDKNAKTMKLSIVCLDEKVFKKR